MRQITNETLHTPDHFADDGYSQYNSARSQESTSSPWDWPRDIRFNEKSDFSARIWQKLWCPTAEEGRHPAGWGCDQWSNPLWTVQAWWHDTDGHRCHRKTLLEPAEWSDHPIVWPRTNAVKFTIVCIVVAYPFTLSQSGTPLDSSVHRIHSTLYII